MIIKSVCNSCFQGYMLLLQPGDMDLIKQISDREGLTVPCPRLCGGRINIVSGDAITSIHSKLKGILNINSKELFRAVMGAGLPDEIPTDPLVVAAMLNSTKVIGSDVESSNGNVYVHELTLENGVTVHLGGGPRGARVVKLTRPVTKKPEEKAP